MMTFDNEVASMTPGQAIMDVPIPKMIENTAKAIAAAQFEMDASSVRAATLMSETRIDFTDMEGKTTRKSLLELGFSPNFYHFSETEMEFNVTITTKVESGFEFGMEGNLGSGSSQTMTYGASISFDLHHKYAFEMTAASKIKTTMRAIPAPQAFLAAIQGHAGAGGTLAAGDLEEPEAETPEEDPQLEGGDSEGQTEDNNDENNNGDGE